MTDRIPCILCRVTIDCQTVADTHTVSMGKDVCISSHTNKHDRTSETKLMDNRKVLNHLPFYPISWVAMFCGSKCHNIIPLIFGNYINALMLSVLHFACTCMLDCRRVLLEEGSFINKMFLFRNLQTIRARGAASMRMRMTNH